MKQFLSFSKLKKSVVAGSLITIACLPYLMYTQTPFLGLKISAMFTVNVVLWQVYQAWTEAEIINKTLRNLIFGKHFYILLAIYFPILMIHIIWLDDWFVTHGIDFRPKTHYEFLVMLPWVTLFQPLFLVSGQYAFAMRIFGNVGISVAVVVLFSEFIAYLQLTMASAHVSSTGILMTGLHALYFGVCYRFTGFIGLSIVSGLIFSRFVLTI
jgi:hypothetical protein